VDFEDDEGGGYVLRKSENGDPDGGSVALPEATLLTFDPATAGVGGLVVTLIKFWNP
jgi:hypothetical protein